MKTESSTFFVILIQCEIDAQKSTNGISHWRMEAFSKKIHFSSSWRFAELKGQAYRPSKHYGLAFLVNGHKRNFMH